MSHITEFAFFEIDQITFRTLLDSTFKDILTNLELDYRVASLILLYFVVPEINIPKIRLIGKLDHIKICW